MANMFGGISMVVLVGVLALSLYWMLNGQRARSMRKSVENTAQKAVSTASQAVGMGAETAPHNMGSDGYAAGPDDDVNPAPLGYASYAYTDDNNFGAYPQSEDSASLTSDGAPGDYELQLSSLMPAGWAQSAGCSGEAEGQWGKFAPTKQAFEQYITASGPARYGMNTRTQNPTGGIQGLTNLIWPVATPVGGGEIPFNDSSFRQDLVYDTQNFYPAQAQC